MKESSEYHERGTWHAGTIGIVCASCLAPVIVWTKLSSVHMRYVTEYDLDHGPGVPSGATVWKDGRVFVHLSTPDDAHPIMHVVGRGVVA